MNPQQFFSIGFHIPMLGCAPTRETAPLTGYPRTSNSAVGLASTLEVPDCRPGRGQYSRQTHPICWWDFPHLRPIFAGTTGLYRYARSDISMRVFLFGLFPQRMDLVYSYMQYFFRERDKDDLQTTRTSGM